MFESLENYNFKLKLLKDLEKDLDRPNSLVEVKIFQNLETLKLLRSLGKDRNME